MKSVLCCIPNTGNVRIELAMQLYQWKAQYGDFFDVYSSQVRPLYEARNDCVRQFLTSGRTWLFFVDSDAVPSPDTIDRLTKHNKKIVGGLAHEMKLDSDGVVKRIPLILKRANPGEVPASYNVLGLEPGLMKVDVTGTVCVMIHKSVFKQMEPPWFDGIAEDFYFYEKAHAQVYVDTDVTVHHFKVVVI